MGLIEKAAPFSTPLLDTPFTKENPAIRRLEGLPGKIVRGDDWHEHEVEDQDFSGTSTEELLNQIKATDTALAMYKRSGIAIPNYKRAALVRWNSNPVLYSIVDEVKGKNIGHDLFSPEELKIVVPAVDRTYTTFIKIADYVFFHGGLVIFDLTLDQLVWGNIAGERNKVYFIDLEPHSTIEVERYQGEWIENNWYFCQNYMSDFVNHIEEAEEKMGTRMRSARRELQAFADQFDNTPYEDTATRLLDLLYDRLNR